MTTIHEPIVLSCAADDLFAMPLAVTVRSVLDNLNPNRKVHLFILDGGIKALNKHKIAQSLDHSRIEVQWVQPSKTDVERLYFLSDSTYPISAYYRMLLPTLIPDDYKKVIYLDSDVVVLEDLEKLWNLPLGDNYLLAAMDSANRTLSWPRHLKHLDLESMSLTPDTKYLQSGVLVIDLEKWRSQQVVDQLIDFVGNHLSLPYPDMDALNFVLANKWGELDPRWNQIPVVYHFPSWQESPYSQAELDNVVHNPFIIHYGSKPKPWDHRCIHPRTSLWYDYLNRTAWAGWQDTTLNHNVRLSRQAMRRLNKTFNKVLCWMSTLSQSRSRVLPKEKLQT
jgi:lipopolysaccharide biosynthesis glycosyltransferase